MLRHAFIYSLVAAADQDHPIKARKAACDLLAEALALRGKKDDTLLRASGDSIFARRQLQRLQTFKERFRLQDHAFAAAERAVIHGAVPVVRELPQIVDFDFRQAHFRGPARNAMIKRSAKEVRKDRDDVGLHLRTQPKPSPQRMRRTPRNFLSTPASSSSPARVSLPPSWGR